MVKIYLIGYVIIAVGVMRRKNVTMKDRLIGLIFLFLLFAFYFLATFIIDNYKISKELIIEMYPIILSITSGTLLLIIKCFTNKESIVEPVIGTISVFVVIKISMFFMNVNQFEEAMPTGILMGGGLWIMYCILERYVMRLLLGRDD